LIAGMMLFIIVVMHFAIVWHKQKDIEIAYTIHPSTETLFIGSSQVGCSIDEDYDNKYNLQKLWVSSTITPSFLMRLKELERRGQLEKLKMIVVPFSIHSIFAQSKESYLWAWYQELPVSWRYLNMVPFSYVDFAKYALCNLRFPFRMVLSEKPPIRSGLASRTDGYRAKFYSDIKQLAATRECCGSMPDWEKLLFNSYGEMNEICKRHKIRFVVYNAPIISVYERNLKESVVKQMSAYEERFKNMGIEFIKLPHAINDMYFFDHVHLTQDGAKIFTADLFKCLNQ